MQLINQRKDNGWATVLYKNPYYLLELPDVAHGFT